MSNPIIKSGVLLFLILIALGIVVFVQKTINNHQTSGPIKRMGSEDVQIFDENWLFARYGLQADGTYIPEPEDLQNPETNDALWRKLDLPHDWAVEGPFRIELKGETGKLPYQGIGWYRKHFSVPAEDAGKQSLSRF